MLRRIIVISCFLSGISGVRAEQPETTLPTVLYLLAGAPTFDLTVMKFREKFNRDNPNLFIKEFHVVAATEGDSPLLTRAASKLNEDLYASTALEKGTGKIKTLQITHLPLPGHQEKAARMRAIGYMAALMRQFEPTLALDESMSNVNELLAKGQGQHFYQQQIGAIRYVVADNGDKGLTFAIEPIKLALADP